NANTRNFGLLVNNKTWTGSLDNANTANFNNGSQWNGTVNNGGTLNVNGSAGVTGTVTNGAFLGNDRAGTINFAGPTSALNITGAFIANPGFSRINTLSDLSTAPGTAGKVVSSTGNSGSTVVDIDRAANSVVVLGDRTAV